MKQSSHHSLFGKPILHSCMFQTVAPILDITDLQFHNFNLIRGLM